MNSASHELDSSYANGYSLTWRIIAAVATCQLLLAVGLSLVAILYARKQLSGTFDTALFADAMSTLALVRYTETKPYVLAFDKTMLPPPADEAQRDLFEIRGSDGRLIVRSDGWSDVPAEVSRGAGKYSDFAVAGIPYRAVSLQNVPVLDSEEDTPAESVNVIFASSLTENHRRLTTLIVSVGSASLLLLLAANAFAVWSVRRGLDPLRELADQASAISVHNWNFRPSSDAKLAAELSPLANAIETVLGRLKESFRQQRDFTNDAAHELKTSVAIVKSTLQSLLHRPRTEREYRLGLEGMLEDCDRLEDLLGRMLRLARIEQLTEHGTPRKLDDTELTSTCEVAISRMRTLAGARDITLEFESPGAVSMKADPEDLELIWLNLLENAVQYSPQGSTVTMSVRRNGDGMAEVSVIDAGPGIPPEELPHIFERFRRGDPSRARTTGGFGLGLAICKALVDAYGGKIEAVNLSGQGTQIRVLLPVQADEMPGGMSHSGVSL